MIGGKHITIECPKYSGLEYYDYKGFFSIVLMDCFKFVNVGDFRNGMLAKIVVCLQSHQWEQRFEEKNMKVPNAKPLLSYEGNLPSFLVGDEIFPLKTWLMRPYPGTLIIASKVI